MNCVFIYILLSSCFTLLSTAATTITIYTHTQTNVNKYIEDEIFMDQFFREGASAIRPKPPPQQHFQPDGGLSKVQSMLDRDKSVKQIDAEIKAVNKMECSHVDFKTCVESLKSSLDRKRKHIQKIVETRDRLTTTTTEMVGGEGRICDEAIAKFKTTLRTINTMIAADYDAVDEVMDE